MTVKIGVVGIGPIGQAHLQCYSNDPLAKVVAVCDVIKEKADSAAEQYGVKAYYSVRDMIESEPNIEMVDVTTGGLENGSWHHDPAMEAMEYGKHVLVEKPLSGDIYEAREMVRFADKKNIYLGCNLNHYFTEPAEKAKKYMQDGQVGELCYCLHKMGFNGGEAAYVPDASVRVKDLPYFHMKAFLTHPFSVMRYFCGDITHIQTFSERPSFRKKAGDVMVSINSINMKFANGCVGYLLSQRGDTMFGLGGWWSLEVGGTLGTFCIENCVEKLSYWSLPKPGEEVPFGQHPQPEVTESGEKDFGITFGRRLHAFLEDLRNKVPRHQLRASGRDALAVLEYTFAAIESYEQGGVMVRPNPLPKLSVDPTTVR